MINTTLLSLRIYGSNALSPFLSPNIKKQKTFLQIEKSHFNRFANSFLYLSSRDRLKVMDSSYTNFLNSAIQIHNYATECHEYFNITNDQLDVSRDCIFIRDSSWNGEQEYAILSAGAVMCERVNFTNCYTPSNGSAIYMVSTNDCELTDCIFNNCSAAQTGGALYLEGKNMKAHMVQITACSSSDAALQSSVYMQARSFIARHFYINGGSGPFRFVQEDVLYYPGYYIVMAHSLLESQIIADVDNITMSDTELRVTSGFAITSSTIVNVSLARVSFSGSNNCIDFTGATMVVYDTNEIYVLSPNGAIFYPTVAVISIANRPAIPIATPARTYDPNNPFGGGGSGTDNGANNQGGSTTTGNSGGGGLSVGYIILIVIACIIVLLAIIGAIYFCLTRTEITILTDEKRTQYNFG